jgi:serine/threonine protein kinase
MDLMKNKKAREDCRKEINLLKQLHHENIIRYYSSFIGIFRLLSCQLYSPFYSPVADQSKEYLMIVLELAEAGDLNRLLRVKLAKETVNKKYADFFRLSKRISVCSRNAVFGRLSGQKGKRGKSDTGMKGQNPVLIIFRNNSH